MEKAALILLAGLTVLIVASLDLLFVRKHKREDLMDTVLEDSRAYNRYTVRQQKRKIKFLNFIICLAVIMTLYYIINL